MKLKLTREQFKALYKILEGFSFNQIYVKEMATKLIIELMFIVHKKFHSKEFNYKKNVTINLTDAEAMAFWMFFQHFKLRKDMPFEKNLIQTISNSIHQKFC